MKLLIIRMFLEWLPDVRNIACGVNIGLDIHFIWSKLSSRTIIFLSAVTKGLHEGAITQSGFIILVIFAMIVHLFLNTSVCAVNLIDESIKCGNIEL